MLWRHWRIPVILILLCYLGLSLTLTGLSRQRRPPLPPTRTPQPTFERIATAPAVLRVLPTQTVRPSRTPVPAATQTAAARPSPVPSATPSPTASPQPTATPTVEPITHTVVRGDTMLGIAQRYGTTVEAIVQANELANPDLIFLGQTLVIPQPGQPGADVSLEITRHIVQSGDTMLDIAQRYGTTVQAIVEANDLANPDLIHPGQALIIPVTPKP